MTSTSGDNASVTFQFAYRGAPFHASLYDGENGAKLVFQGDLGVMPYTGDGPSLRRNTLAVIKAARCLPDIDLAVTAQQDIVLSSELAVASGATPTALLAHVIERLAIAKATLDLVQSLQPPHNRHARRVRSVAA